MPSSTRLSTRLIGWLIRTWLDSAGGSTRCWWLLSWCWLMPGQELNNMSLICLQGRPRGDGTIRSHYVKSAVLTLLHTILGSGCWLRGCCLGGCWLRWLWLCSFGFQAQPGVHPAPNQSISPPFRPAAASSQSTVSYGGQCSPLRCSGRARGRGGRLTCHPAVTE